MTKFFVRDPFSGGQWWRDIIATGGEPDRKGEWVMPDDYTFSATIKYIGDDEEEVDGPPVATADPGPPELAHAVERGPPGVAGGQSP